MFSFRCQWKHCQVFALPGVHSDCVYVHTCWHFLLYLNLMSSISVGWQVPVQLSYQAFSKHPSLKYVLPSPQVPILRACCRMAPERRGDFSIALKSSNSFLDILGRATSQMKASSSKEFLHRIFRSFHCVTLP